MADCGFGIACAGIVQNDHVWQHAVAALVVIRRRTHLCHDAGVWMTKR